MAIILRNTSGGSVGAPILQIKKYPLLTYREGDALNLYNLEVELVIGKKHKLLGPSEYTTSLNNGEVVKKGDNIITISYNSTTHGTLYAYIPLNIKLITGLHVKTKPNKIVYELTDQFNLTGIEMELIYEDGVTKPLDNNKCIFNPIHNQPITTDIHSLEISHTISPDRTIKTSIPILVKTIIGAYLKKLPNKIVYNIGERLDFNGMNITGIFNDGSFKNDYNNYTIQPGEGDIIGADTTVNIFKENDNSIIGTIPIKINTVKCTNFDSISYNDLKTLIQKCDEGKDNFNNYFKVGDIRLIPQIDGNVNKQYFFTIVDLSTIEDKGYNAAIWIRPTSMYTSKYSLFAPYRSFQSMTSYNIINNNGVVNQFTEWDFNPYKFCDNILKENTQYYALYKTVSRQYKLSNINDHDVWNNKIHYLGIRDVFTKEKIKECMRYFDLPGLKNLISSNLYGSQEPFKYFKDPNLFGKYVYVEDHEEKITLMDCSWYVENNIYYNVYRATFTNANNILNLNYDTFKYNKNNDSYSLFDSFSFPLVFI